MSKKIGRLFIHFCILGTALWGTARLYFELTDGFRPGNVLAGPLRAESPETTSLYHQPFSYFGKGCQSYVFVSQDGRYVIKFLKQQHFRPKPWVDWFAFLPSVAQYREKKWLQKKEAKKTLLDSWQFAFDHLRKESGLLLLQIDAEADGLNQTITLIDKLGITHHLPAGQLQFLVQRRVEPLTAALERLMKQQREQEAKALTDKLIDLLLSEHARGIHDNDYALMQNTGVLEGEPVHIDVGQFFYNAELKQKTVSDQQLFDQTYKWRIWLKSRHPALSTHIEKRLTAILGETLFRLKPSPKVKA